MLWKEAHLSDRAATRLHIPGGLAAGTAIELDPAQAHRLRHVLRLGPEAAVAAFNAAEGEWLCSIGDAGKGTRLQIGAYLAVAACWAASSDHSNRAGFSPAAADR